MRREDGVIGCLSAETLRKLRCKRLRKLRCYITLKDSSKNNFPQKTPRKSRGFSSLFKRLCSTDFEHRRTARRTFPFHCRFSVFHSNPCRARIFSLGAALNAIHRSHSFHPLSKLYFVKILSPPSPSHQYNIISSPIARTVKKTIFLSPLKIKEGSIRQ